MYVSIDVDVMDPAHAPGTGTPEAGGLTSRELLATQQMLADSSRIAERTQISRDLHDTIGHSLTVLNVNLELASHLADVRAAEATVCARSIASAARRRSRDSSSRMSARWCTHWATNAPSTCGAR